MNYKIAVIKGDGIGPEIVDATLNVLETLGRKFGHQFKYNYLLAGGAALDSESTPLPKKTIKACKNSDAVLLGAVGDPKWDNQPVENRPEKGILDLREELGLFVNIMPVVVWKQLSGSSPLRTDIISDNPDILIVRESCGGMYFGPKGTDVVKGKSKTTKLLNQLSGQKSLPEGRFAYDIEQYSEVEIRKVATLAFEMAKTRQKLLTSVDMSNILESSRLWRAVVSEVHVKYPEVRLDHMYMDNVIRQLIKNPGRFDVLLTSNMFGDILSSEAGQIVGSIGMLPSAGLGEDNFGLYEPVHGSVPKYAGENLANPIATILSASMMLRYTLGLDNEADSIERAVGKFLDLGCRTPDIMYEGAKSIGTAETGKQIATLISEE